MRLLQFGCCLVNETTKTEHTCSRYWHLTPLVTLSSIPPFQKNSDILAAEVRNEDHGLPSWVRRLKIVHVYTVLGEEGAAG